eukprot:3735274-Rhodomonas_salina.4
MLAEPAPPSAVLTDSRSAWLSAARAVGRMCVCRKGDAAQLCWVKPSDQASFEILLCPGQTCRTR